MTIERLEIGLDALDVSEPVELPWAVASALREPLDLDEQGVAQ
jgi:hypothetical protein